MIRKKKMRHNGKGFVSAVALAALSRLENKRCRDVQKLNY